MSEPLPPALALLAGLLPASGLAAGQQLIPTPYPELLGPNAQIGGGSPGTQTHQHLIPEPVPQSLGPNALGNPNPGATIDISIFCRRPTGGSITIGDRISFISDHPKPPCRGPPKRRVEAHRDEEDP